MRQNQNSHHLKFVNRKFCTLPTVSSAGRSTQGSGNGVPLSQISSSFTASWSTKSNQNIIGASNYLFPMVLQIEEKKKRSIIVIIRQCLSRVWSVMKFILTGLSGTRCLPTGRPMPPRIRREEATERLTTPFPPIILDATLLNLPAIFSSFFSFSPTVC